MASGLCMQDQCSQSLFYDHKENKVIPFIRQICINDDDNYSSRDFLLDGQVYVASDNISAAEGCRASIFYDVFGSENIPFLRQYCQSSAGTILHTDYDLDGNVYRVQGVVKALLDAAGSSGESPASALQSVFMCNRDQNTNFIRWYSMVEPGKINSFDTTVAGDTISLPTGTVVTVGECGCKEWMASHLAYDNQNFMYNFDFSTLEGTEHTGYQANLPLGIVWSSSSGLVANTPGLKLVNNSNHKSCSWSFSERVDLEFGIAKVLTSSGRLYIGADVEVFGLRTEKCNWDDWNKILNAWDVFPDHNTLMTPHAEFIARDINQLTFELLDSSSPSTSYDFEVVYLKVSSKRSLNPFVRTQSYDCSGDLVATLDRTVDGLAYTPIGAVQLGAT